MRSGKKSSDRQATPARIGPRRDRILNLGQFIRSLVLAAFGAVAVLTIAAAPAHDTDRRRSTLAAGRPTTNQGVMVLIRRDKAATLQSDRASPVVRLAGGRLV